MWTNSAYLVKWGINKLLLLYIFTSVWELRTPNTSKNMLSECFLCKKAEKKEEKHLKTKFWRMRQPYKICT